MTTISLKIQIWRYISVSYPAEREVDKLCTLCSFPLFLVFCMCKLKVFIRHLDKTGRRVGHFRILKILTFETRLSPRTADAFPVVASLPPQTLFFGGREATTGNASAVRRLNEAKYELNWHENKYIIIFISIPSHLALLGATRKWLIGNGKRHSPTCCKNIYNHSAIIPKGFFGTISKYPFFLHF